MRRVRRGESKEKGARNPEVECMLKRRERTEWWEGVLACRALEAAWEDWILVSGQEEVTKAREGDQFHLSDS